MKSKKSLKKYLLLELVFSFLLYKIFHLEANT